MATENQVAFTPDEIKVIRFLEKEYLVKGEKPAHMSAPAIRPTDVKSECGVDDVALHRMLARFKSLRIAEAYAYGAPNEWIRVDPVVVDLVHQFDHQPPKDQWDATKKWAYSKPWFVVVMVIIVSVSALGGLVIAMRELLKWFGMM